MWEAKPKPNFISGNSRTSAREEGGQWQRALALLSEMWEAKLEPDVIYTTIRGIPRARWVHYRFSPDPRRRRLRGSARGDGPR